MPLIQALPFPPPPPPQQQQQHQQLFLKGPGGVNLLDSPACAASQIVDALIPIDRLLCELVLPVDTAARPPPFVVRVSLPAASTPSSGPSSSPTTPQLATYQQLIYQQPSAHPTTESTDNTTPPIQNRYPCPFFECAKAFKTAWHRSSHMKLHTTTRDFPCSQCAMTFARRHDVLRHERTVHSRATVKDITCRCGKTFGRIDSLRRHQKMICVLTSKVHAAAESTIHIHNDSKTGLSESDLESRRALLLTHSNQLLDLLVTLAGFAISSVGVTTFLMSAVGFFTPLILASYFMHFAWLAMLTVCIMLQNNYMCSLFWITDYESKHSSSKLKDFMFFSDEVKWMFHLQFIKWTTLCWVAVCQLLNLVFLAMAIPSLDTSNKE